MVPTKRRILNLQIDDDTSSLSSLSSFSCPSSSSSSSSGNMVVETRKRKKCPPDPDVASTAESPPENKRPALSIRGGTFTANDWLPDGWTVVVLARANGQKYKVYKETATGRKFYSKPQVLNYLGIADSSNSNKKTVMLGPPKKKQASTLSSKPLEIPKSLYDLIQKVAKFKEALKLNPDNRFAKRKLKHYKPCIHVAVAYHLAVRDLPRNWTYDPKTFFMAHVPKPPTPPKPQPKPKMKKTIKITWKSDNYHGSYSLNHNELKVWNLFRKTENTKLNEFEEYPYKELLHTVGDAKVVDLLGNFAVNTFNKSCQMFVNKDEDNQVSGAEFMECKFYKLSSKYIFYMTIEAIEQGIPGMYKTRVECDTGNGAMTLQNFVLKKRKPEGNRPWVEPRLEPEVEYETVQDGSSDPQEFYKLTGMVHRETKGGGFNYHNPAFSAHITICASMQGEKARAFDPNVSQPLL